MKSCQASAAREVECPLPINRFNIRVLLGFTLVNGVMQTTREKGIEVFQNETLHGSGARKNLRRVVGSVAHVRNTEW